jgi:hypothetical protein
VSGRIEVASDQLADTVTALEALLNWNARLCVRQERILDELERVVGVLVVVLERLTDETHPMFYGRREAS